MKIAICAGNIDAYAEIAAYQRGLDAAGKIGAAACFIGTMRDTNESRSVHGMTLEHYPGMTEKHITRICEEAAARWPLIDTLVLHRVGEIAVGETIVAIAVWASHRGDALEACRFLIEDLKSRAPFWKKERTSEGDAWVERNTSGFQESEE